MLLLTHGSANGVSVIAEFADPLLLGPDSKTQSMNKAVTGHSKADNTGAAHLLPGGLVSTSQDDGVTTVAKLKPTERQIPQPHMLTRFQNVMLQFLDYILRNPFGFIAPGHPDCSAATFHLKLWRGTIIYTRELINHYQENGLSYDVAYTVTVLYFIQHLNSIYLLSSSDLALRLVALSDVNLAEQAATARQAVCVYQDISLVSQAEQIVAAYHAGLKKKAVNPFTSGARCSLCEKSGCPGYVSPTFLCTNPITRPCAKCGTPHARGGPRKTACPPRATSSRE
jgi:hypothetical protein